MQRMQMKPALQVGVAADAAAAPRRPAALVLQNCCWLSRLQRMAAACFDVHRQLDGGHV